MICKVARRFQANLRASERILYQRLVSYCNDEKFLAHNHNLTHEGQKHP